MLRAASTALVASAFILTTAFAQQAGRPPSPPARDTSAPGAAVSETFKGRISGQITAADSGRPLRRARVVLLGDRGGTVLSDDDGRFAFEGLPPGRYSLVASRTGFITIAYGQRRPLQPGTPLQLAENQALGNVDIAMPRGSVLTGHIYDDTGEPLPGATVRALRSQSTQGIRQIVPAGAADTDDRGEFRIWGLNPGDYLVSATSRALNVNGRGALTLTLAGPALAGPGRGAAGRGRGAGPGPQADGSPESGVVVYAPTYYPGVPSADNARLIAVGLGAEVASIDFALGVVRTSRVTGRVTTSDGAVLQQGNVTLLPETGVTRGAPAATFSSRIGGDGGFAMANVPPGRYVLRARAGRQDAPLFADQPVTIIEGDSTYLTVPVAPGATLTGSVSFRGGTARPEGNQLRIAAPAADAGGGPNPAARVDQDGRFTLAGVSPGEHWIRAQGAPRGWALSSVLVNGRETIDDPLALKAGQSLTGVSLTFIDRIAGIEGTLRDSQGGALADFTVLAFPTDETLWRPQSRYILTTRPDQNGRFELRGLPPGEYFVVPIDPSQPGEWFDPAFLEGHRTGAARLTLLEGETRTQDFRLAAP